MESFSEAWSLVCDYCKGRITEVAFTTWISRIEPVELDFAGNIAVLQVPNDFHRQTLTRCYTSLLTEALEHIFGMTFSIRFVIPEEVAPKEEVAAPSEDYEYTFDTFIVGPSNKFAHAACMAVATKPATLYNPLFIYGNSGLGKTHLLRAIYNSISQNYPEMTIIYIKGDDFTNEMIDAIRHGTTQDFHERYRKADILLVDDIQFIAGKEQTQEEFFHTFNALYEARKQIVISSDKPPKDIPTLEERLRSRFEWGLIADISKPDLETRIAILRKKAELENLDVPDEVNAYIASKVESNIRELEGCLTRVLAYAKANGGGAPVTEELAAEALRDMLPVKDPRRITTDLIMAIVAEYYSVSVEDLKSKRRNREITVPRQIAMYLTRELNGASLPRIGLEFGGRDHTTVIHACDKVAEDMKRDAALKGTIDTLKKRIQGA